MSALRKNGLEWAVFGTSLVIVLAVVGYLAVATVTSSDTPALLTVELGAPTRAGDQFMVPVTVTNDGDTSAENVYVEVVLSGDAEPLRSVCEIAFVPHGSRGDGWVMFPVEPEPARLAARVLGFEEP